MKNNSRKFETLSKIKPGVGKFISDRNLYVLRDKATNTALNVSYTEDGLKWTTNVSGKLLYYQNGKFQRNINLSESLSKGEVVDTYVSIVSNDNKPLRTSNKVYVEKFVPTNQTTFKGQIAEYTWVDKAYHLLTLNAGSFEA